MYDEKGYEIIDEETLKAEALKLGIGVTNLEAAEVAEELLRFIPASDVDKYNLKVIIKDAYVRGKRKEFERSNPLIIAAARALINEPKPFWKFW